VPPLNNQGALNGLRFDQPLLQQDITKKLLGELGLLELETLRQICVTENAPVVSSPPIVSVRVVGPVTSNCHSERYSFAQMAGSST